MKKYKDKKLFSLEKLIVKIKEENKNQIGKWGVQERTAFEWLTYAMEELGELACEITEYEYHRKDNRNDIVNEAIQATTLILKIAEFFLYKNEQQDRQSNEIQNGFVEEKKIDMLGEANKEAAKIPYFESGMIEGRMCDWFKMTEVVKLFQQAIAQQQEEIKSMQESLDYAVIRDKEHIRQLKQKKPDENDDFMDMGEIYKNKNKIMKQKPD